MAKKLLFPIIIPLFASFSLKATCKKFHIIEVENLKDGFRKIILVEEGIFSKKENIEKIRDSIYTKRTKYYEGYTFLYSLDNLFNRYAQIKKTSPIIIFLLLIKRD